MHIFYIIRFTLLYIVIHEPSTKVALLIVFSLAVLLIISLICLFRKTILAKKSVIIHNCRTSAASPTIEYQTEVSESSACLRCKIVKYV